MCIDDGGAAYPHGEYSRDNKDGTVTDYYEGCPGMTLRDHFAGLAMRAMLDRHIGMSTTEIGMSEGKLPHPPSLSRWSYAYAAAMIEEKRRLEKEDTDAT